MVKIYSRLPETYDGASQRIVPRDKPSAEAWQTLPTSPSASLWKKYIDSSRKPLDSALRVVVIYRRLDSRGGLQRMLNPARVEGQQGAFQGNAPRPARRKGVSHCRMRRSFCRGTTRRAMLTPSPAETLLRVKLPPRHSSSCLPMPKKVCVHRTPHGGEAPAESAR